MSKCQQVKELIEELFKDGNVHTIEEITLLAIERKIINNEKDSAVKNALYQMKRDNLNIVNVDKGRYKECGKDNFRDENNEEMFEKVLEFMVREVNNLKKFDWVNCSDEELMRARGKIAKLKKVFGEVQKLIK